MWDWEFFLLPHPPHIFTARGFDASFSWCWNPGLQGLSRSPVIPPGWSARECGTVWSVTCYPTPQNPPLPPATACPKSSPPQLPISAPPTSLDECFFFKSLVVRLPYSSIFWQFWLFFVFKLVVILLLVVQGSKAYLPMLPPWLKVYYYYYYY